MKRFYLALICIPWLAMAQVDVLHSLSDKIYQAYALRPVVKVHVFFNQPVYAPGDTAFFRVALIAADEQLPVKGSQLIRLDVVNSSGVICLYQEFRVVDGWSGNQIRIPDDFEPGIYRVVAYSRWMLNFNPETYFHGELTIAGKYEFNTNLKDNPSVHLFAEGGQLIQGVRNKVIVQSVAHAQAVVHDSQGNRVTDCVLNRNGHGFFFLTPNEGESYSVQIGSTVQPLKAVVSEGVTLFLLPAAANGPIHRLIFLAPPQTPVRKEHLYFIISGHGEVYYSTYFRFDEQEFIALSVATASLPEGVVVGTLFREDGTVLVSRLIVTQRERISVQLQMEETVLPTRGRMQIAGKVLDDNQQPVQAHLSVSVYHDNLAKQNPVLPRLDDQLLVLTNTFYPGGLPKIPHDLSLAELDLMLAAAQWPFTLLPDSSSRKPPAYVARSYPEIRGRIVDEENFKPLEERVKLTFYVQGLADVLELDTDEFGKFSATKLYDVPEHTELYYRAEKSGRFFPAKVILERDSLNYAPVEPYAETSQLSQYYEHTLLRQKVHDSFRYSSKALTSRPTASNPNARAEELLMGADLTFRLSDYVLMPTIQETLHEIIPYLQYRKIRGKDVVRMYLPDLAQTGDEPPSFIIDGILTRSQEFFLGLKPADVETVKIIYSATKRSKLGALGKNGVVLVETRILGHESTIPRSSSVMLDGVTPAISFSAALPSWQQRNDRAPRLRTALYWHPTISTRATGDFAIALDTSDVPGVYVVVIEGLTYDGKPFRSEERFQVQFSPENR